MESPRRQTLIDQVTEQLRREIVGGTWPEGGRIPTEPELCELTGTARNTVREAVQALVHAGMLVRRQGSGTYVLSAADRPLSGYFAAAGERDLMELRETLDVTAAGLAAERRTDAEVEQLNALLRRRNELWRAQPAEADLEAMLAADLAVHRAIVAASHNAVYLEFYDSLLPTVEHHIRTHPVGAAASLESEHSTLVAAVVAGDVAAARQAARALLAELRRR
ncbi:MAG: FCD domain-containing protein [Nocardioides sp.]|uniref:FadR/GntR family transcriptional regulator n=1 Tax=Nocardioides sp. TaxID=35761 RepID=UPI0039E3675E